MKTFIIILLISCVAYSSDSVPDSQQATQQLAPSNQIIQSPVSALEKTSEAGQSTTKIQYKDHPFLAGLEVKNFVPITQVQEVTRADGSTAEDSRTVKYNQIVSYFYPAVGVKLGEYKLKFTQPFNTYFYSSKNKTTDPYLNISRGFGKIGEVELGGALRWYLPSSQSSKDMNRYGVSRAVLTASTQIRKFSISFNNYAYVPFSWTEGAQDSAEGIYNYDLRTTHEASVGYSFNDKWEVGTYYALLATKGKQTIVRGQNLETQDKLVETRTTFNSYIDPVYVTYKPSKWASISAYPEMWVNHENPQNGVEWVSYMDLAFTM